MHLVSSPSSSPLFLLPRLWSLTALANGPLRRGSCVCPVGAICMHNCTIYSRLTRFPLLLPSAIFSLLPTATAVDISLMNCKKPIYKCK